MLSIDYIRINKEKVAAAAINKNRVVELDKIITLDDERRELIAQIQTLREERNKISKEPFTDQIRERGKEIKNQLKTSEELLRKTEIELNKFLSFVPNIPLDEVPVGKDEKSNQQIKTWGNPTEFDFTPLSHIELGNKLDLIDLDRGTKTSGFRGYFIKNQAAQLHLAILFYTFNKLVQKGYVPLIAPAIIKGFTLFGSAHFPWGEPEVYKLNDDDTFLSGTAEIPITALYANEILNEKDLPKKMVAFSPCFRREIGSYGKDTHGLYRVHEFMKVEQVIISRNDLEQAKNLHEELQKNTEEILQELELPYRVMLLCTGEMGEPQIKKYDTEVWMPSRKSYGEVASNSILGDFQTRRLKIKYRTKNGSTQYCYSLNNTALASPRLLIALLENHQQVDGSIIIPPVLHQYVGKKIIKASQSVKE